MTQVSAARPDAARLAAIRRTALLDSPTDPALDRLTRLASRLLGTPVALVSLVDEDRQYFASAIGLGEPWASRRSTPLAYSYCRHVVASGEPLAIEDARRHPLVRTSPSVRELGWIAYLGVPLTLPGGHVLGALSVIDTLPRVWSERDLGLLRDLGASAVAEIELRTRRPETASLRPPGAGVFEQSAVPMGLVSLEGHWLRVNRALADLLGTTPQALAGCPAEASTYPADRGADREALRLLLAGECGSFTTEKRLVREGEEPCWVVATITLIPEDDGVPEHLHVVLQDITDRRLAEQELREHEERSRLAADAALDAVLDWDLLTDLVVWRERPGGAFGYHRSAGSATAAWWYDRLHPEDRERVVGGIHAAMAAGATRWSDRYRFRRANDSWAEVEERAAIVRDDAGDAVRMVGALADVSPRVRAERLGSEERRLLGQIAGGRDLVAVLEEVARLVESEVDGVRAAVALLDREAGLLRLAAGPSLAPALRVALETLPLEPCGGVGALAAARRAPVELPDVAGDDAAAGWRGPLIEQGLHAAWSWPLLAGGDGELLGALDVYAAAPRRPDASERALLETAASLARLAIEHGRRQEAPVRSARFLEQVLDALPLGVWVLDRDGGVLFANPAAREVWGGARYLRLEELHGRGWRADTGAPIAPDEWAAARAIRQGETSMEEVVVIEAFDGRRKTILNSAVPLRGLDGAILGAMVLHQDVTERHVVAEAERREAEQLRRTHKMEAVAQLAGGIAHEFNNLLTGVLSYAELVLQELHTVDPLRADVEQIQSAGRRAAELTRQLLAFSRHQVLQPVVLSLNATVAGLEGSLRRVLGGGNRLETELAAGIWPVLADPGQLEQVLVHLVTNARDAMPRGGVVTIATANVATAAGDAVALVVRDTGEGMDAATQDRIFEPFFTTKAVGKGSGLGLATVYGIVEQSGGRIAVESAPGRGATFTVTLPRYTGAGGAPVRAAGRVSLPTGTETVLLVEDEAAVRSSARRLLERHGYAVVEARRGDEALRIADEAASPIDLVVTDLVMPGMDGRELAERLRARHPGLKVLFMSGYDDRALAADGTLPPGTGFVEKPFTMEQLIRRTREMLDAR